ncbi:hypothetical protein ACB092_12G157100 [Castanea dentata]
MFKQIRPNRPTQIFPWRFTVGLWNFASSSLPKLPVVMVVLLLDRSNGIKLISNWFKLNTDRSSLGNPGKTRRGEERGHYQGLPWKLGGRFCSSYRVSFLCCD